MGGMLLPHHRITPNHLQKTSNPGSFAPRRGSLLRSPWQSSLRSLRSAVIRSEANGAASPRAVRKHSKEELIAFFRDIQTSIADSSPKPSRRTGKLSPDPFQEVENGEQSHGVVSGGNGGTDGVTEERRKKTSLDDMTVAELRELARARRMRGYSKLKKGELVDRLKGVSS